MYVRTLMAQGEFSQTSERTRHAMRALKAKGIACGGLPYGKEYSDRLDAEGRRVVVENPAKIATIARVRELHAERKGIKTIADILIAEGRPPPKTAWSTTSLRAILIQEGLYSRKTWDRTGAVRDQDHVLKRIVEPSYAR